MIDKSLLDEIIIGRVEPRIYAFTSNTIPNCLKVGDTYRPVSERLKEWKERYPDLTKQYEASAKINDDVYFRDFSVHQFLEAEKQRVRLKATDISQDIYFSKEFFKDATATDIEEAINDIQKDYEEKTQKYHFYNAESRLTETLTFARTESFEPRPNQQETINNFNSAIAGGRKNLLMYAVMRFGKSFTSMCCAVEMNAKLVAVVSAKAEVMLEWKKTVESHVKFEEYEFITGENLKRNNHIITEKLSADKKVVVFLTLQDLQGKNIKEKHLEVFGQDIDLLLVDETHFGARAEKYGEVLKPVNYETDIKNKQDDDCIDIEDADKIIKTLKANITVHLSGTPYRILMGSEFKKEDIIAFYQFTDIADDQKEWDNKNLAKPEEEVQEEWKNPYYGFPQMVRFAFLPNASSRRRLEELKKSGTTYAFSALLKPQSIKKSEDGLHKRFIYEQEVLELLEVIDGSRQDDTLLSFLNYEKLKEGKMCRHIVIVLPYCASCDAMESLIKSNANHFINLNEYEIINISGIDNTNSYHSSDDVKIKIRTLEEQGKRSITLTVNRMLTGSTLPEWDTMLYLKDTASPQEYDQAVFRLQNQYVKEYKSDDGKVIKYNMKPQTLLVDFDPNRMFVIQESKSKIYNANVDAGGNAELERRMEKELEISPIIVVNKGKIERVQAANILEAVSNYQKDKGIKEEALEIPADLNILQDDAIRGVIELENEIGSKSGLSIQTYRGEADDGVDINVPDAHNNENEPQQNNREAQTQNQTQKLENSNKKKIQSYYARILLFAFITNDEVKSLSKIIESLDSEDNKRIAENLGLKKEILILINQKMQKFILSELDYKIQDLNGLSRMGDISPADKAAIAVNKFGKLGDAIVITPPRVCEDIVKLLPDDFIRSLPYNNGRILDIAGTSGEFAVALHKQMTELGLTEEFIKNAVYTIPKSSICYELTRKLYEMLGLNIANIVKEFIATDLLTLQAEDGPDYKKIKAILTQNKPFDRIKLTDTPQEGEESMKFDAIVGNPPYQEDDGGAQASAKPLYHNFVNIGRKLSKKYVSIIIPARWYAGGKGLNSFRDSMIQSKKIRILNDFNNSKDLFSDTEIKGGVCYFLLDNDYEGKCFITNFSRTSNTAERYLCENSSHTFIRYNQAVAILNKIGIPSPDNSFSSIVSSRKPYGLNTSVKGHKRHLRNDVVLYGNKLKSYINRSSVKTGESSIDSYKVFISYAYGAGEEYPHQILNKPFIGAPGTVCTETYLLIGPMQTEEIALNVKLYIQTRFFRFLVLQLKPTQHATKSVYAFVPMQDFTSGSDIDWTKPIIEIDRQLYAKYNLSEEEIAFIESMIKPME